MGQASIKTNVLGETALGMLSLHRLQSLKYALWVPRLLGKYPDHASGELPGCGAILVASTGTCLRWAKVNSALLKMTVVIAAFQSGQCTERPARGKTGF